MKSSYFIISVHLIFNLFPLRVEKTDWDTPKMKQINLTLAIKSEPYENANP